MNLSILIPMRNEERFVSRCLDSILPQLDEVQDAEVFCIDGASSDKTRDIIQEYARRDFRVKLVDNPAGIVPVGMNNAIRQSRGDVVMRLDCHAEYANDYIKKSLEVLRRTRADNVGGYMRTLPGSDSPIGRAIAAATSSSIGVGGATFRTSGPEKEADTVPFGCFRRDVFEMFGLYDERLVRNQDIELNSRIRNGGGRIMLSPDIRLTYYNRSTFAGLRQQAFNNGLWNPYTLCLVGGGLRLRHFAPLAFVLSIILLAAGGVLMRPLLALLAVEVIAYIVVVATACQRASKGFANWGLTVLAMVQLHVAYGVGSLWGVLSAPVKFGLIRSRSSVVRPLPGAVQATTAERSETMTPGGQVGHARQGSERSGSPRVHRHDDVSAD